MPAKTPKGTQDRKCSKCDAAMEEGVIIDRGPYAIPLKPQWAKGGAEFSWKTGLKTSSGRMRTVATWRCTGCGFLESYAK